MAVSSGQARKRVSAAVYIENLVGGSEKDFAREVFVFVGGKKVLSAEGGKRSELAVGSGQGEESDELSDII